MGSIPILVKKLTGHLKRTVLASLCAATVLGMVGVPGASARTSSPTSATYVVKPGEWLSRIASKNGVKFADLLAVNGFSMSTVIHPGQTIKLPTATSSTGTSRGSSRPSSVAVGGSYTVKSGDFFSRIASKNGVKVSDLLAVNGFSMSTVIHPGQTIKLPVSGSKGSSTGASRVSSRPSSVAVGGSYTVKSGDFFSRIASKNGVKVSDLLAVNGFSMSTVIHPGQTIKLPASGSTGTSSSSSSVSSSSASPAPILSASAIKLIKVVEFAKAQEGKPYLFGAVGPDAYDCSGLVRAAYRQVGISLPHSSYWQSFRGTAVDWRSETILPGDLVFTFSSANPTQISHVGIAISDSQWIEAPYTGANVRITRMPSDTRIQEVRRIIAD